jgi:hypothetical protein
MSGSGSGVWRGAVLGAAVGDGVPGGVGEGEAPPGGGVLGEHRGQGAGVVGVQGAEAGDLAGGL